MPTFQRRFFEILHVVSSGLKKKLNIQITCTNFKTLCLWWYRSVRVYILHISEDPINAERYIQF